MEYFEQFTETREYEHRVSNGSNFSSIEKAIDICR